MYELRSHFDTTVMASNFNNTSCKKYGFWGELPNFWFGCCCFFRRSQNTDVTKVEAMTVFSKRDILWQLAINWLPAGNEIFTKLLHFFRTGVAATAFSVEVSPWLVVFTYGVLFGLGTGIGYVVPLACGMRVKS